MLVFTLSLRGRLVSLFPVQFRPVCVCVLFFFLFSSLLTACGPTGYENTTTTKNTPHFVYLLNKSTYMFISFFSSSSSSSTQNNVNQLTVDKRNTEREISYNSKKSYFDVHSAKVKCIELLFTFIQ
jgi:hypothetical protein